MIVWTLHYVASEKLKILCMGSSVPTFENDIVFGKAKVMVLACFHSKSASQCQLHRNFGVNSLLHGISMAEWLVRCKSINCFFPLLA